jgi:hypothetical protein
MQHRHNAGSRPQITFTADFHELVQGDLVPGPCVVRYDPLRLVDIDKAHRASHSIRAYVRFHPMGLEWQGVMALPAGIPLAEQADVTGQGFMLSTQLQIPDGCDELEAWFSCTHEGGETHWDSDHGKNHWLRFGLADLRLHSAEVIADSDAQAAQDRFKVALTAKACVEAINLRWRITNVPNSPRAITPLERLASSTTGTDWATPAEGLAVPAGSVVAFDLVYTVKGRRYTDDNQGRWYIAD